MDCLADIIPMRDEGERFFPPTEKPKEGVEKERQEDEYYEEDHIEAYSDYISAIGSWRVI
jgi:hypothetical protein